MVLLQYQAVERGNVKCLLVDDLEDNLGQHVPIIFVTAGSRDPLRLFRGYDQGAVDFRPIFL